jgi:hypothetical protein
VHPGPPRSYLPPATLPNWAQPFTPRTGITLFQRAWQHVECGSLLDRRYLISGQILRDIGVQKTEMALAKEPWNAPKLKPHGGACPSAGSAEGLGRPRRSGSWQKPLMTLDSHCTPKYFRRCYVSFLNLNFILLQKSCLEGRRPSHR